MGVWATVAAAPEGEHRLAGPPPRPHPRSPVKLSGWEVEERRRSGVGTASGAGPRPGPGRGVVRTAAGGPRGVVAALCHGGVAYVAPPVSVSHLPPAHTTADPCLLCRVGRARAQGDAGGLMQKRAGRQQAGSTYRRSLTLPPSQGPARAHGQSRSRVLDHSPDHHDHDGDGEKDCEGGGGRLGWAASHRGGGRGRGSGYSAGWTTSLDPCSMSKWRRSRTEGFWAKALHVTECIRVVVGRVPIKTRKRREVSRWEEGTASGADETSRGASMSSPAVAEVRSA